MLTAASTVAARVQGVRRARPAIVRAIAGAHGATLTAKARPRGGLDIEVSFGAP